ncbi:pyridoxamine 5'-phosphate oxidase family protein [Rhizobium tumorigenes]|uniref:pyridoxamine 5'-phosphate oxidase family protein n=1 Tax=Rhizobium tumorigenes TaxID=2041385 RepID=UPI00241CF9AB|nr:pyridoxamine 5'-phosphate oxidase family protein [Rhizobium tumorigenes]WFS02731.1 pyridoxamine 5'-phosphate oxidase family protein [Rhizobium tumorigenes]
MTQENEKVTRTWELMEKIVFCMLSTRVSEDIRSRPMAAHFEPIENAIYFLTDVASHKDEEIERRHNVGLSFADTKGQKYVSVTADAEVSNDRERIRELFSTPAKAWWDSAEDPSIRVLKVTPKYAEYWDSPGTVVSYVKMIAAALSSTKPDMGENAKVSL